MRSGLGTCQYNTLKSFEKTTQRFHKSIWLIFTPEFDVLLFWHINHAYKWCHIALIWIIDKSPLSGLRHFLIPESSLEIRKMLFTFTFLTYIFGHEGKWLDKKAKVNSKIYDVTGWVTTNYNTYIPQNLNN